MERQYPKR